MKQTLNNSISQYETNIKLPCITTILKTKFYTAFERERDCLKHTLQYPVHVHDGLSDSKNSLMSNQV